MQTCSESRCTRSAEGKRERRSEGHGGRKRREVQRTKGPRYTEGEEGTERQTCRSAKLYLHQKCAAGCRAKCICHSSPVSSGACRGEQHRGEGARAACRLSPPPRCKHLSIRGVGCGSLPGRGSLARRGLRGSHVCVRVPEQQGGAAVSARCHLPQQQLQPHAGRRPAVRAGTGAQRVCMAQAGARKRAGTRAARPAGGGGGRARAGRCLAMLRAVVKTGAQPSA